MAENEKVELDKPFQVHGRWFKVTHAKYGRPCVHSFFVHELKGVSDWQRFNSDWWQQNKYASAAMPYMIVECDAPATTPPPVKAGDVISWSEVLKLQGTEFRIWRSDGTWEMIGDRLYRLGNDHGVRYEVTKLPDPIDLSALSCGFWKAVALAHWLHYVLGKPVGTQDRIQRAADEYATWLEVNLALLKAMERVAREGKVWSDERD